MISRRHAFVPVATALAAPALLRTRSFQASAGTNSSPAVAPPKPAAGSGPETAPSPDPKSPPLPARYDEPLGIGLEGWAYPAPLRWRPLTVNGQSLRMAYMDIPPTAKNRYRAVVLLHGKMFDSSYWAGPIKDLAQAGFRVIVPDQIGFHKSSKPDIGYSLDLLADLTMNLLAGLQIDQASFIGHSMGGAIAVRIATTFPQRVQRLILEDPIGLIDHRRFIPAQSIETLIAAELRLGISAHRAMLRHYCPSLPPKALEPFVEWRMRVAQSGEFDRFCKAAALTQQMIYREPVRYQVSDITAPTLMIIGEKDQTVPLLNYASPDMMAKVPSIPQVASEVMKDVPKGSLSVIPGVGHVPHLEAPDAFREKTIAFLTS